MTNPKTELRTYLKRLINNLLYLKSLDEQLKIIKEWETPNRIVALNIGAFFIGLVVSSFYGTILIELYKLFAPGENRTIVDFLSKLKTNLKQVAPTRYNFRNNKRGLVNLETYERIIGSHEKLIERKSAVIEKIKSLRDKITHADKKFFNNPAKVFKKYSVSDTEIDDLLNVASKILEFHHAYLFESDLTIKIHSSSNISSLLIYARAFDRIWHDNSLNNIKKYKYKLDEYKP